MSLAKRKTLFIAVDVFNASSNFVSIPRCSDIARFDQTFIVHIPAYYEKSIQLVTKSLKNLDTHLQYGALMVGVGPLWDAALAIYKRLSLTAVIYKAYRLFYRPEGNL